MPESVKVALAWQGQRTGTGQLSLKQLLSARTWYSAHPELLLGPQHSPSSDLEQDCPAGSTAGGRSPLRPPHALSMPRPHVTHMLEHRKGSGASRGLW